MENTDNTTNFVSTEEHINNQPEATITTSTDNQPVNKGKSKAFSKHPDKKLSQTEIRLKYLSEKVEQIIQYLIQNEKEQASSKVRDIATILEIMDNVYKDCPKVREDSISKEQSKDYVSVCNLYYKQISTKQIVKIIPLEDGWKMIPESFKPNSLENPTSYEATFEFKGIAPRVDYPVTYTVSGDSPNSFIMKLRDYLLSLNEEKIIVTSGLTNS